MNLNVISEIKEAVWDVQMPEYVLKHPHFTSDTMEKYALDKSFNIMTVQYIFNLITSGIDKSDIDVVMNKAKTRSGVFKIAQTTILTNTPEPEEIDTIYPLQEVSGIAH